METATGFPFSVGFLAYSLSGERFVVPSKHPLPKVLSMSYRSAQGYEINLFDMSASFQLKVTLNAVPLNGQNERYLCCYFGEMTEVVCEVAVKKVIVDLQSPGDYLECPTPSKEDILSRMAPNKGDFYYIIYFRVHSSVVVFW